MDMASSAIKALTWGSSVQTVGDPLARRSEDKESTCERLASSYLVLFHLRQVSRCNQIAHLHGCGNVGDSTRNQIASPQSQIWHKQLRDPKEPTNTGSMYSSDKQGGNLKLQPVHYAALPRKYSTMPPKSTRDPWRKGSIGAQLFVKQIGSKAQKNLRHLLSTEFREIRSLSMPPDDTLWSFLNDALRQQNWRGALDVFAAMKQVQGYRADARVYTMMLRIMARSKQPYRAFQLFEEMEGEGCGRDVSAFTALLDAYGRSGLLEQALAVFGQMKTVPACKPNVYTYNCMINAYGRAQLWDKINGLTEEMDNLGVKPLDMTFNVLISAYGRGALYDQMERVFERMQKEGCKPDVFTFNTMIDAYGKGLQYSEMEWTYSRMLGTNCDPDIFTYSSLMDAYRKAGLDEKVEETLDNMCKAGCKPDVKAYSLLIDMYGKRGRLVKMEATLEEMQSAGCRANIVTYTGILDAYGKAALYRQMEEVWLSMSDMHLKPDISAYVTMLSAYGKGGLYDRMEMVFEQLKAAAKDMKIVGPKPGCPAYNVVIDAYGTGKLIGKMEAAFQEMQDTGHQPSAITYNALIDAYGKVGLFNKMERMYVTMKVTDCEPNVHTYGCLLDGYGRLGMVGKAEKVVEDMREAGYPLDVVTYTCIIDAYGRAKNFQTMLVKFREMTAAGFEPSSETVSVILSSLSTCRSEDVASKIVECIRTCSMFRVVGQLLDEGDGDDSRLLKNAEMFFDKLLETGPQFFLFDALVDVLWTFGWYKRAIQVLNLGRKQGAFPHSQVQLGTEILLDLHMLSSSVAEVMLLAWLSDLKAEIVDGKVHAAQVSLVTGWGRRSKIEGDSPLKAAVIVRLASMRSPFRIPRDNAGRLVSPFGEVRCWLLCESVATHLALENADHPGPGHALKQCLVKES